MVEPWIRVHARLSSKPVAIRLSQLCRGDRQKAVGVLCDFWGNVSEYAKNGFVRDYDDHQLEVWANWTGKRGAFAKWVRDQHMDADGRVKEWDEYQGALEARREADRRRKQEERALKQARNDDRESAGSPQDSPQDNGGTSAGLPHPRARNGTGRYGTETEVQSQNQQRGPRIRATDPPWVADAVAIWERAVGLITATKVRKALTPLVDAHGFDRVKAALEVYVSPDEGPPADRPKRPDWFAESFHRWRSVAETPLSDADGVLTERGRRFMQRPA